MCVCVSMYSTPMRCQFKSIAEPLIMQFPLTLPSLNRGRMLVQAGEEEDIVYADIGEWCSSECDITVR